MKKVRSKVRDKADLQETKVDGLMSCIRIDCYLIFEKINQTPKSVKLSQISIFSQSPEKWQKMKIAART